MPGKRDGIFWGFMNYVHVLLQIFFYVPVISHKRFHPLIIDTNWTLMNPSDWHFMDGMKFLYMNTKLDFTFKLAFAIFTFETFMFFFLFSMQC